MTAISLPPLVLRNGTRIESVLETALEFVEQDGSYRSYDLAPVEQDDVLTESDIRVANAMIARMSPQVIAGIYARRRSSTPRWGRFRRRRRWPQRRTRSPGRGWRS